LFAWKTREKMVTRFRDKKNGARKKRKKPCAVGKEEKGEGKPPFILLGCASLDPL
jgi:hypothetical protein